MDNYTTITVRIKKELRRKLDRYCERKDITISQLVRRYLRKAIKEVNK